MLVLQTMVDEQLADEMKKPVVVFVRDQLMTDGDCRYSPGGASLTDSGRGNSDCGEEQSTPSMTSSSAKTSPRHDVNSKSISTPVYTTGAALHDNNEASAKVTTQYGRR